ncbi:MAG: hypothetical protein HPY54_02775 [Chthonomonadetes bacterium]|nr:hypothetical protein [Chthonomonadetes bacterium]
MAKRILYACAGVVLATVVIALFSGCGSHQQSAGSNSSGRMAEIVLTVEWQKTRVIPPETEKIDITIVGDGLGDPMRDTITRTQGQTSVTKVYTVPIGYKRVTAEAKDASNRLLASGVGETYLQESQRSDVAIEMTAITFRTVTLRFFRNGQPAQADFVAFQDGDSAWQAAQGSGGVYQMNVSDPGGRYGVAIAYTEAGHGSGSSSHVQIFHATVEEVAEIRWDAGDPPATSYVTVSGTVTVPSGNFAMIAMRQAQTSVFGGANYSLSVAPGVHDLAAALFPSFDRIERLLLRRGVQVAGDTTIDISFDSAEAFSPASFTAGVEGGAGTFGGVVLSFTTAGGTTLPIAQLHETDLGSLQLGGVPASKQQEGDIHSLTVFSYGERRTAIRYFKQPNNLTITLPPPFGDVSVTSAGEAPYLRLTASWQPYQGAQGYFMSFISESVRSRQVTATAWFVSLSSGWMGGGSSYTLPDLSAVPGWNNSWGLLLVPRGWVSWEVGALTSNMALSDAINREGRPVDGLEVRLASKQGSYPSD